MTGEMSRLSKRFPVIQPLQVHSRFGRECFTDLPPRNRLAFQQHHVTAGLSELQCGSAAGGAAAQDENRCVVVRHGWVIARTCQVFAVFDQPGTRLRWLWLLVLAEP